MRQEKAEVNKSQKAIAKKLILTNTVMDDTFLQELVNFSMVKSLCRA
jgi:hypothetical protein